MEQSARQISTSSDKYLGEDGLDWERKPQQSANKGNSLHLVEALSRRKKAWMTGPHLIQHTQKEMKSSCNGDLGASGLHISDGQVLGRRC